MRAALKQLRPVGVVLAGGRSSRMGREKSFLELAGKTMLQHSIDRLSNQLDTLVISANGDPSRFEEFGLPVLCDTIEGFKGPLAGILAGMLWAREHDPEASHILTIASDTPFFPPHLATALMEVVGGRSELIAVPQTGERLHPAFGMWPLSLAGALEQSVLMDQLRVHKWLHAHEFVPVEFALIDKAGEAVDPFFNINTPEDLERARGWLTRLP